MGNGSNPQTAPNARPVETGVLYAPRAGKPHIKLRADGSFSVINVGGPMDFFGPQQPLHPVAQGPAVSRQFDYPAGFNTRVTPRLEETLSFGQLKAIADTYDVLRLIIETRKDELAAQSWTVGPKDRKLKPDARCTECEAFFQRPDKFHDWPDWLRQVLEQLFVLDAVSINPRMTRGGDLYALDLIDGAMIKRVITDEGRTPLPEEGPAYQQIIKGLPAVDYVTPLIRGVAPPIDPDGFPMPELIYRPRNLRVHKIYGFSPVEQIVTTVNIALRRQYYQLAYYTDGSTPDLIFSVPETWNPDQIAQFQQYWQAMLEGNLQNRRGTMFVPKGVDPYDTKEKALKDEYDEWLTRICCFAFSISPAPFIKQMNRSTAQSNQEVAIQQGLEPVLQWLSGLMEYVIRVKFGYDDLAFRWQEDDPVDPAEQATIFGTYVDAKVYHPDEVRQKLGDDPMAPEMRAEMDQATFARTANATVLPPDQQAEADARMQARAAAMPKPAVPGAPAPAPGVAGKMGKGVPRRNRDLWTRSGPRY